LDLALLTPGSELCATADELLPAPELSIAPALVAPLLIVLLMALFAFAAGCSEAEAVSSAELFTAAF
jgi:hypothetical protein